MWMSTWPSESEAVTWNWRDWICDRIKRMVVGIKNVSRWDAIKLMHWNGWIKMATHIYIIQFKRRGGWSGKMKKRRATLMGNDMKFSINNLYTFYFIEGRLGWDKKETCTKMEQSYSRWRTKWDKGRTGGGNLVNWKDALQFLYIFIVAFTRRVASDLSLPFPIYAQDNGRQGSPAA